MEIVSLLVGLGTAVFKYLDTKEGTKYIDEMVAIQKDILAEKGRGYDADDAKIETLHARLKIIVEAAQQQLAARLAAR